MSEDRASEELAKLQKKLYRRDAQFGEQRSQLEPLAVDPQAKTWHQESGDVTVMTTKSKKRFPLVKFIFIVSLVFFVGAVGLAGFQYFNGLNVVSGTNIDLSVEGPEKVNAGEVLQISVATANRNQKNLEDVKLTVTFPDGTKESEDPSKNLRELRENIGVVNSGQVVLKTFKSLVYGEEKQEKQIDFVLQYRIAGSNAIFTKKESYVFAIGSSPVRITASLPEEVNSGQPMTLEVQTSLNANTSASDLAVVVSYPPGFTFSSADPAPTNSTNVWSLADLAAGKTRTIRINGTLEGQNDDVKSFRINAGTLDDPTDQDLAVEYNTLFKVVSLRRPFVDLNVLVSGSDKIENAIDSEKVVQVEILWKNTLPVEIRDGKIEIVIDGEVVDKQAINTAGGNYDSEANTITWTKNDASLRSIGPGATARVGFNLVAKSLLLGSGADIYHPEINLKVKFTGTRVSGENVGAPVEVEVSRVLRVNTIAQFLSKSLYHTGDFAPTGPMPPRVGQETLYTIDWTVLNSSNNIKEAKVRAVLPTGLRFVGSVVPSGEDVTYDPNDGVIVWNLGTVKPGSSVGGGQRQASFQVGLTPSANQIKKTPVLISNATFSGIDTFTQKGLNVGALDVDIRLFSDKLFNAYKESVVVP